MINLIGTSDLHAGYSAKTVRIHDKFFEAIAKEIEEHDVKALLLAGDLISHKQKSLKTLFKTIRKHIPTLPVLGVLGNHDFWDEDKYHVGRPTYEDLLKSHHEAFNAYGIIRLDGTTHVIEDVSISGFDGWYAHIWPPTNDRHWMNYQFNGIDPFVMLNSKAHTDLASVLSTDTTPYRKSVCVTHFPPFTENVRYEMHCGSFAYMKPLAEKFDAVLVGHSHKACDFMEGKCRFLNCGSDYDKPKHILFTI